MSLNNHEDLDSMKLADLFDLGWQMQCQLSKSGICEQSSEYIVKRLRATEILTRCQFMLDELHLFSENEGIEELSTSELRYFLNDALLAWLFNKVNSKQANIRLSALNSAKTNFTQFLELTRNYDLHKFKLDFNNNQDPQALLEKLTMDSNRQASLDKAMTNTAYERVEKIRRYKEQKELERQMEGMQQCIDSVVKKELVDDEKRREYYMACIKFWINMAIDEMKCINDEINILQSIETNKTSQPEHINRMHASIGTSNSSDTSIAPQKPFIITKNAMQAKVFGLGYPSVPVYTIDEFYDQKVADGCMPQVVTDPSKAGADIGGGVTDSQKEDDKALKDKLADEYDEEEVVRMRGWDEFTDENKRGEGNTYNRS